MYSSGPLLRFQLNSHSIYCSFRQGSRVFGAFEEIDRISLPVTHGVVRVLGGEGSEGAESVALDHTLPFLVISCPADVGLISLTVSRRQNRLEKMLLVLEEIRV